MRACNHCGSMNLNTRYTCLSCGRPANEVTFDTRANRPADDGLVARLEELATKATKRPWETDALTSEGSYGCGGDTHEGFKVTAIYDAKGLALFDALNSDAILVQEEWDEEGYCHASDLTSASNAALIVELVNNLPAILTALRAQSDAEVERIVAWLNQLGDIWSARQIAAMIERGEHRKARP